MRDHIRPYAGQPKSPAERHVEFATLVDGALGAPQGSALWVQFVMHYRMVRVARDTMRNPEVTQQDRDLATVEYGRGQDALMDLLDIMMDQNVFETLMNQRGR